MLCTAGLVLYKYVDEVLAVVGYIGTCMVWAVVCLVWAVVWVLYKYEYGVGCG